MMLLEVSHSWAGHRDVTVSKQFHTLSGQKWSQVFKFLIGLLARVPSNFRNVRAYILISLGQLMLRIIGTAKSRNLIVHHLGVFRSWLDRTTELNSLLESHGPKENIILNALIFAGLYTHVMPPEKVLLQDWTMQTPVVCYEAAFDAAYMFPYMVAALITHTYIEEMEIHKQ